jgi:3-hydroxyisobutyrate dehydrogenase-like beta-hydroxyacid dehydrogenase
MRNDYSTSRTAGIVGLGIMGGAMARALRSAGYTVHGYDPLTAPRTSTTAVAERVGTPITSLPSSAALEDAVDKIARAKHPPHTVIEMSTLPLADVHSCARVPFSRYSLTKFRMSAATATARA